MLAPPQKCFWQNIEAIQIWSYPDVQLEVCEDDIEVEFLSDEDFSSVCVSLDDMATLGPRFQGTILVLVNLLSKLSSMGSNSDFPFSNDLW